MRAVYGVLAVALIACEKPTDSVPSEAVFPESYQTHSALEKASRIVEQIERSRYETLPPLESVDVLAFLRSQLEVKMSLDSDEAPAGYHKAIHKRAVVAEVEFVAKESPYTGLFRGVKNGFIRASVTSDPKGKDFAPGIALKFLIDGKPSQNVAALYKLSGQKEDHNFFAHELSHIIPFEIDPKSLFSSALFRRVTPNPTKLSVEPFAAFEESGKAVGDPLAPEQLYFVPTGMIRFPSHPHDSREDFLALPPDSVLYKVMASRETGSDFRVIDAGRRERAVEIGEIISRSRFVASEFGDLRMFFKHHRYAGSK